MSSWELGFGTLAELSEELSPWLGRQNGARPFKTTNLGTTDCSVTDSSNRIAWVGTHGQRSTDP